MKGAHALGTWRAEVAGYEALHASRLGGGDDVALVRDRFRCHGANNDVDTGEGLGREHLYAVRSEVGVTNLDTLLAQLGDRGTGTRLRRRASSDSDILHPSDTLRSVEGKAEAGRDDVQILWSPVTPRQRSDRWYRYRQPQEREASTETSAENGLGDEAVSDRTQQPRPVYIPYLRARAITEAHWSTTFRLLAE